MRLPFERYAGDVLPQTHELWGHGLEFSAYVERNRRIAQSAYGRSSFSTFALSRDGQTILASFKRYERSARAGSAKLAGIGIGAVFTPQDVRGSGYATAMLALALDQAKTSGVDFAFLYSDIHPQFYRDVGFREMPSRSISVRADSLSALRVKPEAIDARDWSAVRACFDAMESVRKTALERTPAFWSHVRLRSEDGNNYLVRDGSRVRAYVLGRREPRVDTYVVNEIGVASEQYKETAEALVRGAAGDLRRVSGWLPPSPARSVLPRGSVRTRMTPTLMMAALTAGGKDFIAAALERAGGDPVWKTDHV